MSALRFALSGPRSAPLALLLHGFMGSRRDWAPVAERLSSRLRCLTVDLPGHGETGDPREDAMWTVSGCAEALFTLLDEIGARRAGVVGYSLGGRLALHLAATRPERFTAAVILSASPGLDEEAERAQRRDDDERLARLLETQGLERFLDAWYRLPLFEPLRESPRFDDVRARRLANDPLLLARSLRSMGLGAQRSLWAALPDLRIPLLLAAGERDLKFSAIARAMAARCPGAAVRIVPGRGHALVEEDSDAVADAIAGALIPGRPPRCERPGGDW